MSKKTVKLKSKVYYLDETNNIAKGKVIKKLDEKKYLVQNKNIEYITYELSPKEFFETKKKCAKYWLKKQLTK